MCGIAGAWGHTTSEVAEVAARLIGALHHRGPDDRGVYVDRPPGGAPIALAHARLSIIDLAGGHQPIFDEDGSTAVVFNGEIYNYRALRSWLLARGHRFATSSDTECIVHLYQEVGADFVHYLRGMFAIALWDRRQRRLVLARDRLGIKPLYWYADGERFWFASEATALFCTGEGLDSAADAVALRHYFALGYIPSPRTAYARVRKLPPGCVAVVHAPHEEPTVVRYWDPQRIPIQPWGEDEAFERLAELVDDAVSARLIADVPLGAFLSGGVDSSIVVAAMTRQSQERVQTFAIGFSEATHNELPYARAVADHLGTQHREEVLHPDAIGLLDQVSQHLDEPFGDSSALPMLCVSAMARKHVTVALSGDGGDELFGGYDRYRRQAWLDLAACAPRQAIQLGLHALDATAPHSGAFLRAKRLMERILLPYPDRYVASVTHFPSKEERLELFSGDFIEPAAAHQVIRELGVRGQGLAAMQRVDLQTYLPEDILTKVDRMSMAVGLEARVPLLDHRLVEFALALPARLNGRGFRLKPLLKRLFARDFPAEWAERPKQGFAVPLAPWMRGPLREVIRDTLLDRTALARGVWTQAGVERLLQQHDAGADRSSAIWLLLMYERWARRVSGLRP